MPRRVRPHDGRVFEGLGPGIAARAAYLASGFPGIGHGALDAWRAGEPFTMTAGEVWHALATVDIDQADDFAAWARIGFRYEIASNGVGYTGDELLVLVDPRTSTVSDHRTGP
jgi:hypothetical protein